MALVVFSPPAQGQKCPRTASFRNWLAGDRSVTALPSGFAISDRQCLSIAGSDVWFCCAIYLPFVIVQWLTYHPGQFWVVDSHLNPRFRLRPSSRRGFGHQWMEGL